MKSNSNLKLSKEGPHKLEGFTFQNKYAKLRNVDILKNNQKLVSTITRIESSKGAYNSKQIDKQLFKPPKNNKIFYDIQKQKQILNENEVT